MDYVVKMFFIGEMLNLANVAQVGSDRTGNRELENLGCAYLVER